MEHSDDVNKVGAKRRWQFNHGGNYSHQSISLNGFEPGWDSPPFVKFVLVVVRAGAVARQTVKSGIYV
jgi:hypothetical protein